jgi:hypothetical protein
MLSHRKDPRTVFKSYAYAAAAKMEGVGFYFFSPGKVKFDDQSIEGWIYENGQWIQKRMPFPDVIYNASPPQTEKQEEVVDRLSGIIPFTSHSIGSKLDVYQKIKKANSFFDYLIPSIEVTSAQILLDFLTLYEKIVIKPVYGHKGHNIIFVRKYLETYIFQQDHVSTAMNEGKLKNLIEELITNDTCLAQAFIESNTKSGMSSHFRLHIQKEGEGEWSLSSIFPCIAPKGFITNISSGGFTMVFEEFLKQEFDDEHYNIKRYLEQFAIQFSKHFDRLYQNRLDELGIDVGLDKNQKIWIYEVNWRPGPPPSFSLEIDVAKKSIRYARYLAENS